MKVPTVGESITEGRLITWFKEDGAIVQPDEPLFELETDKITMEVQSECSGKLHVLVPADTDVEIGQTVGFVEDAEAVATPQKTERESTEPTQTERAGSAPAQADRTRRQSSSVNELRLSPTVRRLVAENELDPRDLTGTGRGGRLTKKDVLTHVAEKSSARSSDADKDDGSGDGRQTRRQMSPLRQRVAQRLLSAQHEAAILTTFNEVDMTQVMRLRHQHQENFSKRYGIKLGIMSFFVKAVVDGLKAVPALNARIEGSEIVTNHFFDISIAVSTEKGLVVPVLREADQLAFSEIENQIADLAKRANAGRLELSELVGGCFTISNGGVFGSLLSTPILNPPQGGILGLHTIKKRAVVVNDQIEIRPMMYLALSYDHRLIDGREAVTFLRRVVECIESPERILIGV